MLAIVWVTVISSAIAITAPLLDDTMIAVVVVMAASLPLTVFIASLLASTRRDL
ncbi:hypothetical protein U1707_15885 [Sphingomonas sp. PB2P12]|uniref:hypothetical protein n=1 Tax=Sphingomonas sandaracina TaxID=3096157 RepID=UPI002FC6B5AC